MNEIVGRLARSRIASLALQRTEAQLRSPRPLTASVRVQGVRRPENATGLSTRFETPPLEMASRRWFSLRENAEACDDGIVDADRVLRGT